MCFGFAMKKGYKMVQGEKLTRRSILPLFKEEQLDRVKFCNHSSMFEIACCVSCQQVLGSKVNLLMMIFISYHH